MTTYLFPMLVFAAIGLVAGVLLTVCSKIFEVKGDEKIEAISEALPQVNCGAAVIRDAVTMRRPSSTAVLPFPSASPAATNV